MDENKPKSKLLINPLGVVIILGLFALLAYLAIPNFSGHSIGTAPMNVCINNLRQIDAAIQQWALENNVTNSATIVTWNDVRPYLGRDPSRALNFIYCPKDTTHKASNSYTLGDVGSRPKCKINPATHRID